MASIPALSLPLKHISSLHFGHFDQHWIDMDDPPHSRIGFGFTEQYHMVAARVD